MDVLFPPLVEGIFIRRPNRFLAVVLVEGREEIVHVPNTGRMKELFLPGARVWLASSTRLSRKTAYTLKLIENADKLIAVDTNLANDLVEEALKQGKLPYLQNLTTWQREVRQGASRFDFCLQDRAEKIWLEVKSVNLVEKGLALFPDAPTTRGTRHVRELLELKSQGQRAIILFVVMRADAVRFEPYIQRDPDFAQALQEATKGGVEIYVHTSQVGLDGASLGRTLTTEKTR